jgi:hypothetical protein
VRFTVKCVFNVNFEFSTLKITLKTHATVKRTSKLHIQNASVIDPLCTLFYNFIFLGQHITKVVNEPSSSRNKTPKIDKPIESSSLIEYLFCIRGPSCFFDEAFTRQKSCSWRHQTPFRNGNVSASRHMEKSKKLTASLTPSQALKCANTSARHSVKPIKQ